MVSNEMLDLMDACIPQSVNYIRVLLRPSIKWSFVVLKCLAPLLAIIVLKLVLSLLGTENTVALCVCVIIIVIYSVVFLKQTLIDWIMIYQSLAPDSIRNKCRFEPSCSRYMIESLKKHGVFEGLAKGLIRLSKCNNRKHSGGGYDYP